MDISEVNDHLEGIDLPAGQKRALVQLIDTKINSDMKEVIAEIRRSEERLEAKLQITNDKLQMTNDKLQTIHDKLSNEIKVVYWVIATAMAIILFVVARK